MFATNISIKTLSKFYILLISVFSGSGFVFYLASALSRQKATTGIINADIRKKNNISLSSISGQSTSLIKIMP
jgi:hypothetical protein